MREMGEVGERGRQINLVEDQIWWLQLGGGLVNCTRVERSRRCGDELERAAVESERDLAVDAVAHVSVAHGSGWGEGLDGWRVEVVRLIPLAEVRAIRAVERLLELPGADAVCDRCGGSGTDPEDRGADCEECGGLEAGELHPIFGCAEDHVQPIRRRR